AVDGEARYLFVGQAVAQRQAFQVLGFLEQSLEPLAVARLNLHQPGESLDRFIEVAHPGWGHLERVSRVALREHDPVAIGYHAAVRNDWNDGDAVALGQSLIVVVLYDLQIDKASEQSGEYQHDERGGNRQATAKVMQLALRILELRRGEHRG